MSAGVEALAWPLDRIGEALDSLGRHAGMQPDEAPAEVGMGEVRDLWTLGSRVLQAATRRGLDAVPEDLVFERLGQSLASMGPGVIALPGHSLGVLVVLGRARGGVRVLGRDHHERRVPVDELGSWLLRSAAPFVAESSAKLLDAAGLKGRRRDAVLARLLAQRLTGQRVSMAWRVRSSPGASFVRQLALAGVPRLVGRYAALHVLHSLAAVGGTWMLARGAIEGAVDRGWLIAWGLLLITAIPLQLASGWAASGMVLGVARLLRRRLLAGALRSSLDAHRREGSGMAIGRVMEAQAIEGLSLGGGMSSLVAVVDLVVAGVVLSQGAAGLAHAALLAVWVVGLVALVALLARRQRETTDEKLGLANGLVEKMLGHRTRLAQQAPSRWHEGEDEELARYIAVSSSAERVALALSGYAARGWVVASVATLIPFLWGDAGVAKVAIALGGVLMSFGAIQSLARGVGSLVGAWVAWARVRSLFDAARSALSPGRVAVAPPEEREPGAVVVRAEELSFAYPGHAAPVLRGVSLALRHGDRVLLEGASGGGKSTLGSILAGLRQPSAGVLLVDGLDLPTLGVDGWRRRVVVAPQFHENHVFANTLAFNLLMGRRWPPTGEDLTAAEEVCRELGLGALLDRMPMGMQQLVGETGWQLSHGERSRVFLARALLQGAEVVVLDESLGALDPETHVAALRSVLARAPVLVLIAHP